MDNCYRSRVPKISLPYSILAHVSVKMIKDSVQQVLALHRSCVYPKSRVCSDIAYKFPRYFLRFATIENLILIWEQSHCVSWLDLIKCFPETVPTLGCQLWNYDWDFVQCPRTLTMMLKEKTGSYFKPFFPLIGLENSSDKSRGQRSLERHP